MLRETVKPVTLRYSSLPIPADKRVIDLFHISLRALLSWLSGYEFDPWRFEPV